MAVLAKLKQINNTKYSQVERSRKKWGGAERRGEIKGKDTVNTKKELKK